jgi:magnesium transporter
MAAQWTDLLDPTPEEIRAHAPRELAEQAVELLTSDREPRPTLQDHGEYTVALFVRATVRREDDDVCFQQVGVVATREAVLTVRRTPSNGEPYEPGALAGETGGEIVYRLLDDLAECYLDVVDDLDAEIDELEDQVDDQSAAMTRQRISVLRHDLLHIRSMLAPMRDISRRLAAHELEIEYTAVYDKLLRAADGLELTRDLLAGVRDYAQSQVALEQNEVTKRLTVVASLLLAPTFIVGVYGQNFDHMPELHWGVGYAFSWGLIVVITLVQLWWFKRKRWI